MEKVLDKAVFDVVIQLVRDYWRESYYSIDEMKERLDIIRNFLDKHFKEYKCLYDFLQVTISTLGVNHDATNEQIYGALECLGWRVKDEEHVS